MSRAIHWFSFSSPPTCWHSGSLPIISLYYLQDAPKALPQSDAPKDAPKAMPQRRCPKALCVQNTHMGYDLLWSNYDLDQLKKGARKLRKSFKRNPWEAQSNAYGIQWTSYKLKPTHKKIQRKQRKSFEFSFEFMGVIWKQPSRGFFLSAMICAGKMHIAQSCSIQLGLATIQWQHCFRSHWFI